MFSSTKYIWRKDKSDRLKKENKVKKQTKAIHEHGKQLAENNDLVKQDNFDNFDSEKDVDYFWGKNKY